MPPNNGAPLKVAILGAGPAGLAAAWGLTTPQGGVATNVDVTIYDGSWRAGGKCTSARLPNTNAVVQNGTHYLFGVYFNTFALMDAAFQEVNDTRFGSMNDLVPRDLLALKHEYNGNLENWKFNMTARGGQIAGASFNAPLSYLASVFQQLQQNLAALNITWTPQSIAALLTNLTPQQLLTLGLSLAVKDPLDELLQLLINAAGNFAADPNNAQLVNGLEQMLAIARSLMHSALDAETALDKVQFRLLCDFAFTMIIGVLKDKLLSGKIADIDAKDFKQWLQDHGATQETLDCPLVRTWYEVVAAFVDGDPSQPSLSAAAVMQMVVPALVAYRGAFCYQMKPEVGENLVAPVYAALVKRGVKFRFLHELTEITPSSDGTHIEQLTFRVPRLPNQPPGAAEAALQNYDALDEFTLPDNSTRMCWPRGPKPPFHFLGEIGLNKPSLRRFWGPARDEVVRNYGPNADFDHVIFALPHLTIPRVASELMAQKPRWNDLATRLPGVETKSLRIWLKTPFQDLQWDQLDPTQTPVLSAYKPMFSTWEDSGQQLALQTWPQSDAPQSIATVLGPLKSRHTPFRNQLMEFIYGKMQQFRARKDARAFLSTAARGLWPGISALSGELHWDQLVPPGTGPDAVLTQWVVANTGAAERYTHAAPGTFQYRLRSNDTDYANLSVAGEWTRFWPAVANVELTVMSGLRAAYDILGINSRIPSEGGFFPS